MLGSTELNATDDARDIITTGRDIYGWTYTVRIAHYLGEPTSMIQIRKADGSVFDSFFVSGAYSENMDAVWEHAFNRLEDSAGCRHHYRMAMGDVQWT